VGTNGVAVIINVAIIVRDISWVLEHRMGEILY